MIQLRKGYLLPLEFAPYLKTYAHHLEQMKFALIEQDFLQREVSHLLRNQSANYVALQFAQSHQ